MKRLAAALAVLVSVFSAVYAQVDFDRGPANLKEMLSAVDAPLVSAPASEKGWFSNHSNNASAPSAPKEWTVMVYINGKNDLEAAGLYSINKMELAGSGDSLNIVAEIGRMNGQQNDIHVDGDWTGSRRYYVTRDTNEEKIKSKQVQSFDRVDMGDWKHLVDFAKWGMKNYPAKHYALIICNHGTGWVPSKDIRPGKGISYDFESNNNISTPELGMAMKEIGKVDILGCDACLMQMAEIIYEVKDYADYIVGSEETIPGYGYPYDTILAAFAGSKSSEELASAMVSAYDSFYSLKGKKVTLSAVRVSALCDFVTAFNVWTDALLASDKKPELKKRLIAAAAYTNKDNKDLYDFARLAAETDTEGAVGSAGRALMEVMSGKLIISNTAYKEGYGRDESSHGLAIYLPASGYNAKYDNLAWARDTKWDDFLKAMKDVSAPGLESISGCTDPGPGASLEQLLEYVNCLTNSIGKP